MQLILFVLQIYELIILGRVIISWIRPDPYHPVVQWINRLTEPVLEPVRRILPMNRMGIDFSPLIVLLLLHLLGRILFRPVVF